MVLRARRPSAQKKQTYSRDFIGDAIFTDDPNDDWFCISFDVWVGDFCPNCMYVHKATGRVKTLETSLFSSLLAGFFVASTLTRFKFCEHHKRMLERLGRDCFKKFNSGAVHTFSLDKVVITMSQQRV